MKIKKLFSILGPGLLYAGAAVGVSHLVQSTRAGADYGFDLALVLIVANILKYPFFEFAPRYANTTGESLVDGYRKIGKWAVVLFALVTVLTMTAIAAAVLVVTAGLTGFVLNLHVNILYIDAGLLITAAVILLVGKYKALDTIIKYIIVLLAVSTFVAVFSAMGATEKAYHFLQNFDIASRPDILFLIAFVGWMPAPIDVSVWHSLWSKEKRKTQPKSENPSYVREGLLDFRIGYIGTAIVALAFLTLGAFVMV